MLGQYPHCQPAEPGRTQSADEAQAPLRSRAELAPGVDCFVCLQAALLRTPAKTFPNRARQPK